MNLFMKRLAAIYCHYSIALDSKDRSEAFRRETKILREISHQNIRRLHRSLTRWIPTKVGHFYYERIQLSLLDTQAETFLGNPPLNALDISHQLIIGMDFLHTRDSPISHGGLDVKNVFLNMEAIEQKWIVKIGNFSQAKIVKPGRDTPEDDLTMSLLKDDMHSVARIVFFLLKGKVVENEVSLEELAVMDAYDVHLRLLIIALQRGLTASDALLCPTFEPMSQKVTVLSELNGLIKKLKKNEKNMSQFKVKAAKNGRLVIGGQGAWNKLLEPVVMEEFGLDRNNHDITSFVSLLRIIRNILQHPEAKDTMMAICGKLEPNSEEILVPLLQRFPWFYPHSLFSLHRHIDHQPSRPLPSLFTSCYSEFEDLVCEYGIQRQALQPLQTKSYYTVQYDCVVGSESQQLVALDNPQSCIYPNEGDIARTMAMLREKAGDSGTLPLGKHVIKFNGKVQKEPFALKNKSLGDQGKPQVSVPEGTVVAVMKPEIQIEIPQKGLKDIIPILPYQTSKIIKGFAVKKTKKEWLYKDLIVSWDGATLTDDQLIVELDFTRKCFVVKNGA